MKQYLLSGKTLIFVGALAVMFMPTHAHAQTIASWDFKIYNVGAANPISTTSLTIGVNTQCNLTPATPVPVPANPGAALFDDPINVGKQCKYTAAPTDPLRSMPITGSPLEAGLNAISTTGLVGASSARVPFAKPGTAPGVPTGFTLQ